MISERILITGATGFVGRHLVQEFASAGREMTLAVRALGACPQGWRDNSRIRIVVTGPIETANNLPDALHGASTVVHLSGLAHASGNAGEDDPWVAANVIATEKLTTAAAAHGVRTFIHMSSLAAIARNSAPTIVDDMTCNTAPTPFGRSKREAEKRVSALAFKGIFSISLRPPLVVGADAKGNWCSLQRLAATGLPLPFGSIRNRRSLISINSLIAAISLLCKEKWPATKSGDYCIADEEIFSLPTIVSELRRGMGLSPRLFPFPTAMIDAMARMVNRQHLSAGILGDMHVDASRFRGAFGFAQKQGLAMSIFESGRKYHSSSYGEGGGTP